MEDNSKMAEDQNSKLDNSYYHKVVRENSSSGSLKMEATIHLTTYDTSKMEGYKEGTKVYKGFTCSIRTLKPNKEYPNARIDIDPSNNDLRKAILEMYTIYDKSKDSLK